MSKENTGVSKMSPVKWGLFIAFAILIDIVQVCLDIFFGVGLAVNRFINIGMAGIILLVCWLNKIPLSAARLTRLGGVFLGETIPVADILPLWSWFVIKLYFDVKKADLIAKLGPVGAIVQKVASMKSGKGGGATPPPLPGSEGGAALDGNTIDLRGSA